MYFIDSCPCCGAKELQKWPAIVAPFVSQHACGTEKQVCSFCECGNCTFRFFDSRLTDSEIAALYAGYRGPAYYEARHRHEFWYTEAVNAGIGSDPGEIQSRKQHLEDLLAGRQEPIQSVLDYGGDRGQFIPDHIGTERYVFEISGANPVPGVTRLRSIEQRQFDLVMLAHVLEHCSAPLSFLANLRSLATDLTIYYFEVPFERPSVRFAPRGLLQRMYRDAVLCVKPLLTLVDFYSTVCRVKFDCNLPFGLLKCSEHLNFFNEKSMSALLERGGYELLECGKADVRSGGPVNRILYVLARLA